MNKFYYIHCLAMIICFYSCHNKKNQTTIDNKTKSISTHLELDHLNIWVNNPTLAKKKLTDIGFTSVPDSLSKIHTGQGTAGKYFHFLNNYLELIFVNNQNELEQNNRNNKDLDFTLRANFETNGASPFSIALKVRDYDTDKIPFKSIPYHQNWMEAEAYIYAAKNSKIHLMEPSIFVIYPEIESGTFSSMAELENFSSEDNSWKAFFKHPNGAKKITNVIITSTNLDLNTNTVKAINEINNLSIQAGSAHLMELYFDNNIQKKSFDLRPELPLIIYL